MDQTTSTPASTVEASSGPRARSRDESAQKQSDLSFQRNLLMALITLGAVPAAFISLVLILLFRQHSVIAGPEAFAVFQGAQAHALLIIVALAAAVTPIAVLVARAMAAPIQRLQADVELMTRANSESRIAIPPERELAALAAGVNALADARAAAMERLQAQVTEATLSLSQEKETLASILFALSDGVVVTDADLRITLSNQAARELLSTPAHPLRRGESLYTYLDSARVRPVVTALHDGPRARTLHRTTVALPHGLALLSAAQTAGDSAQFVFVLREATSLLSGDRSRDETVGELTQRLRGRVAAVLSFVSVLQDYPDLEPTQREHFLKALREQVSQVSDDVTSLDEIWSETGPRAEWTDEQLDLGDLVARAVANLDFRVAAKHLTVQTGLTGSDGAHPARLRGDGVALAEAVQQLVDLALTRANDHTTVEIECRQAGEALVDLKVSYDGLPISPNRLESVFDIPMAAGRPGLSGAAADSLREVVKRHRGEVWARNTGTGAVLTLVLPRTGPVEAGDVMTIQVRDAVGLQMQALAESGGFYEFAAEAPPVQHTGDEVLLRQGSFVVFDLETTGLQPLDGDRIVSIGAVRVERGRVLREDYFYTLVNPERRIPEASAYVHGITDELVTAAPSIERLAPQLLDFRGTSVPVAHVAQFDLAFLDPPLERLGLPGWRGQTLDTLLLTIALFPTWEAYNLEDIASRLGVSVVARHSALGDALTTAEVFVTLLGVLETRGVRTVGDALRLQNADVVGRVLGTVRAKLGLW